MTEIEQASNMSTIRLLRCVISDQIAEIKKIREDRDTLLEILQELIDIEGPQPGTAEWANKALVAIAKATGATNE